MKKQVIQTDAAPSAIGPYSQGCRVGNGLVFLSGQLAMTPDGTARTDESVETQTKLIMENIGGLLKAIGCGYDDIVKTTIFLTDMNDFTAVNGVYGGYFQAEPPARSTVAVAALPKAASVEIECVVWAGAQ